MSFLEAPDQYAAFLVDAWMMPSSYASAKRGSRAFFGVWERSRSLQGTRSRHSSFAVCSISA